jgi:hypothetical protein
MVEIERTIKSRTHTITPITDDEAPLTPTPNNTIYYKPWKGVDNFPRGDAYTYCPDEIRQTIEVMDKTGGTYTCTIENPDNPQQTRTYKITLLCPASKPNSHNFIETAFRRMYRWLVFANPYAPTTCSQTMSVYIYFTPLKKYLPKDRSSNISEYHANTGFTTSCKKETEMNVFREEEWFKVFVHETFHNMGLDFSHYDTTEATKKILTLYPVNSDVNVFETYCEMWAELINLLYIALFTTTAHGNRVARIQQQFEIMVYREQMFSLFQCAKILYFYGLSYRELYEKTAESHQSRLYKYKEKTNVLSYYVIKCLLLFHANEFIEWCAIKNQESIRFSEGVDDTHIQGKIMNYCQLVESYYTHPAFLRAIAKYEDWFRRKEQVRHTRCTTNKRRNKTQKREPAVCAQFSSEEFQTLRMTVYEI